MAAVAESYAGAPRALLSPAAARAMPTPGPSGRAVSFAVRTCGPDLVFSHSGGTQGFRAFAVAATPADHGIVVTTNSDDGDAVIDALVPEMLHVLGWGDWPLR
jgi:hypothetical protein